MNGIINVFKPENITSYGVIRRIKQVTGEKKIGHLGTLDPMAVGVLPLFLGKMTKLISHFNEGDKVYHVKAMLGASSTTLDREGEITEVPIPQDCVEEKIRETLLSFIGEIEQVPPMYSAVKVGGKKLYEYARQGKEIERKSRKITIHWIRNIQYSKPELSFDVFCSKGTYIRTLAADVAEALGTAAYLKTLVRTGCGQFFNMENAIELDQIEKLNKADLFSKLIKPESIMPDWHKFSAEEESIYSRLRQGASIRLPVELIEFSPSGSESTQAMALGQNRELIAIGDLEFSQESQWHFHPSKVLI